MSDKGFWEMVSDAESSWDTIKKSCQHWRERVMGDPTGNETQSNPGLTLEERAKRIFDFVEGLGEWEDRTLAYATIAREIRAAVDAEIAALKSSA